MVGSVQTGQVVPRRAKGADSARGAAESKFLSVSLFGFLAVLEVFALGSAHAQRLVPAPVLASHVLDLNDGKRPIYHREACKLVPRPGVYPYAYGPTIMFDARDQTYKVWAGVGWNGDTISSKQGKSLNELDRQPWEIVLEPRREEAVADQEHCCDPCVIAAEDGYYLYYTGAGKSDQWPAGQGYVMVAFSKDGRKFKRLNNGLPMVDMGKAFQPGVGYGVGQPAVTLGPDGWYYMIYTYSADNQYPNDLSNYLGVIRSRKPDFIKHEQVARLSRQRYGCSNDLVYDPESKTMVMVINESHPARGVQVRFVVFSADFKVLDDCYVLVTNLSDKVLGEGLGILTDSRRRWLHTKDSPGQVTVSGATYRKRGDQPEHIAGPVCAITWGFDLAAATGAKLEGKVQNTFGR